MKFGDATGSGRGRGWLAGVLLVALVVRVGWGVSRPVDAGGIDALPDQRDYLSIAENLVRGEGLQFIDKRFGEAVWAFRTPGYPFFLATFGGKVRMARAVQGVIDTSTVLAVYLLAGLVVGGRGLRRAVDWRAPSLPSPGVPGEGKRDGGAGSVQRQAERIAIVAAGIVAVNPYLVYFSGLLLSETLFTAMLAWGMVLMVWGRAGRAADGRGTLAWVGGGVLLALSILVRPSAVGLPVGMGVAVMVLNPRVAGAYQDIRGKLGANGRGWWRVPVGAVMVGLTLAVLVPWGLRNVRVLGNWVWLDTNSGFTLYDGYNPDATGASDQSYVTREPALQAMGELDRSAYLADKAWRFARENPWRCVKLAVAKMGRTWSPVTLSSEYGQTKYRVIAVAYSLPLDVLVVMGLLFGSLSRRAKLLLMAPAVYFTIVHALTVGSLRYRIPAEPPMAIIAAAFLAGGLGQGDTWRRSEDVSRIEV